MDIKQIKKKLIVSCQALPTEPLFGANIMAKMAIAATNSGASGIRANTVNDINAIKKVTSLPMIGIIKKEYPNSEVYITPTLAEVRALATTAVEIIALDATLRKRPKETLEEEVIFVKKNYPNILLMADCSTVEEAKNAENLGFDFVGTTLYGYTSYTVGKNIADDDFEFLKNLLSEVTVPVIAEGKIDSTDKAKRVLELGAYSVVVGGAITRPQEITERFVNAINSIQ